MSHKLWGGTNALSVPFHWRTAAHVYSKPSEMTTSHLFFVIRMIWNNSAPERMRVGKVKLYRFPPFYTPSYMRQAVDNLSAELRTRQDIPYWMMLEIEQMLQYLNELADGSFELINNPPLSSL